MNLANFIHQSAQNNAALPAWRKIPWNKPGFSRRMLANHLEQNHDWASRLAFRRGF